MDQITQGLIGAVAAQASFTNRLKSKAFLAGMIGGFLADLDFLYQPQGDPLAYFRYHRQFSHSLLFIPIGGLLAVLPFLFSKSYRKDWKWIYLATTAGYATHGILDSFTTWGTQLLWPFSNMRISFDSMPIVDPIFTFALLLGAILSLHKNSQKAAIAALVFCSAYICLGFFQRNRAIDIQTELAQSRNAEITKRRVLPLPGSLILWRSLFIDGSDTIHVDSFRLPFFSEKSIYTGSTTKLFSISKFIEANKDQESLKDGFLKKHLETFDWFTDGYVAKIIDDPLTLGDLRFSPVSHGIMPMWGIELNPDDRLKRVRFPIYWKVHLKSLFQQLLGSYRIEEEKK